MHSLAHSSASHCAFIKTCCFWNAAPPSICGLGKLHVLLSVWGMALWKCGAGLEGHSRADYCETSQTSSFFFFHVNLGKAGVLEPELWPWILQVLRRKVLKPEQWASLFTLGGWSCAGVLASREVEASTVATGVLGALVLVHKPFSDMPVELLLS